MFKFHSIRSRLTVTFLGIILAVMLIIGLFLYNLLERYFLQSTLDNLTTIGKTAAVSVAGHLRDQPDPVRLSAQAESLARQSGARVIFVNQNGVVVGDSVRVGGLLGQDIERDEAFRALEGEVGSSIQISERTGQQVMQVAVPVSMEGERPLGVVFLSASLSSIYGSGDNPGILTEIRRLLYMAIFLAIVLVGGGSIILAGRFTGPLELLSRAARSMGTGKLDQQIQVDSQDEIGQLAVQFNEMASRLDYYTSKLRSFVTNVSHELRTPIASLNLLTQSLKDYEMEPGQRQEFLKDMEQELNRLGNLVSDLLELTKLDEGEMKMEPLDLKLMLEEVAGQAAPRYERHAVSLEKDLYPEPIFVQGSPTQLRQAVYNLLDNAVKYTSPGGCVKMISVKEKERVMVSIQDTGCGIPAADLPNIFERFYRVDEARSRDVGGTGLGLAIFKETINAHGGRVWVKSVEGEGTTFYFDLPIVSNNIKDN